MSKPCPHCSEPIEASLFFGSGRGQPTKLSPELQGSVCGHIRNGATLQVACDANWVNPTTVRKWRVKGEAGSAPHAEFFSAIAHARALFETDQLTKIASLHGTVEAFDEDGNSIEVFNRDGYPVELPKIDPKSAGAVVKAITWLLERTRRERYGAQMVLKIESAKDEMVDALMRVGEKHGWGDEVLADIQDELLAVGQERVTH